MIGTPSLILGAGAAGVGKTTVLEQWTRETPSAYLANVDQLRESFLWSNPFERRARPDHASGQSKGALPENKRMSFNSKEYAAHLRDQQYASMFQIGVYNARQGKSTVADANYVGWIREPEDRISLSLSLSHFLTHHMRMGTDASAYENLRVPILFFHVTEPELVKQRTFERMLKHPNYFDQDMKKLFIADTPEQTEQLWAFYHSGDYGSLRSCISEDAWKRQLAKEPVTLEPMREWLGKYADVLTIDRTPSWEDQTYRRQTLSMIDDFMAQKKSLATTGILAGESLETTLRRYSEP